MSAQWPQSSIFLTCQLDSFIVYFITIFLGDQIEKDEMDGSCSTY